MSIRPVEGARDARVTNADVLHQAAHDMSEAAREHGSSDMTEAACLALLTSADEAVERRARARRRAAEWVGASVNSWRRGSWYRHADLMAAGRDAGHAPNDLLDAVNGLLGSALNKSGEGPDLLLTPRV